MTIQAIDAEVPLDLPDGAVTKLPLQAVRRYERNPRTRPNPKHDEIKESIRAIGLTSPITVTRRPGDNFYICFAGGGTRLAILNELANETLDPHWQHVEVKVKDWPGEVAVQIAHIAENDKRSDISFWERALALQQLKQEMEKNGCVVTASELETQTKANGGAVSLSTIQLSLFAVENLAPVGPWLTSAAVNKVLRPKLIELHNVAKGFGVDRTGFVKALESQMQLVARSLEEAKHAVFDPKKLVKHLQEVTAQFTGREVSDLKLQDQRRGATLTSEVELDSLSTDTSQNGNSPPTELKHPETITPEEEVMVALGEIACVADLAELVALEPTLPLGYLLEFPQQTLGGPQNELKRAAWNVLASMSGQFDPRLVQRMDKGSNWYRMSINGHVTEAHLRLIGPIRQAQLPTMELATFLWTPSIGELFARFWTGVIRWRETEPERFIHIAT